MKSRSAIIAETFEKAHQLRGIAKVEKEVEEGKHSQDMPATQREAERESEANPRRK